MTISRFATAALIALLVSSSGETAVAITARTYAIVDPVLSMHAWTLALPVGWTARGTMLPGSSCSGATSPVYKATSADGTSGAYFLPRVDWAWGPGAHAGKDCSAWSSAISARDFLRYELSMEHVRFVSDQPAPAPRPLPYGASIDQARALARYTVAGRPYEEIVETTVTCNAWNMAAVGDVHQCSGFVRRWFGPAGTVVSRVPMFESLRLTVNPEWMARWTTAMRDRSNALSRQQTQALLRQGDLAQSARMRQHDAFMASMERQRAEGTANFQDHEYAKQRNSDNFVDYVLDCTRYYNTSATVRVSGTNCPNRQTF